MKTFFRCAAAAILACVLTACPETTVDDDFGLKPAVLNLKEWSGAWVPVDDDDALQFTVTDAAAGVMVVTEPGKKDDKPIEFKLRRAVASEKVKLLLAVARERDGKKPGSSLFLMREANDGVLYTWMIDHDAVAAAIKAGQLKGVVNPDKDGAHSHLDSTPANYAKLMEPQFWNWSEPTCLKRVKK
ncbi:hypothetical protein [Prosthecobacter sp.]|uniref:hypothetical protein n=1 Tax=Prosthecobacter sp. TaxID=1965333 RepID=UPI003784C179